MILIILTYLAGILTILSPCILPVLPFVFSRSNQSFAKSSLPLLGGMSLTFSLFSAIAIAGGEWIGKANEVGRILAMVFLSLFALSLIFDKISEKLLSPLTQIGSKIGSGNRGEGAWGSFLIGISTGLLWAPCAGPILGLVLTGAASQGKISTSILLLASYSLGAATSLAFVMAAGGKFLGQLKKFLGVDRVIKKILGIAVLLGVLAIALNLDRTLLTRISKIETASLENKLLSLANLQKKEEAPKMSMMMMAANQPQAENIEGLLPDFNGATAWLNSKPLSNEDLLGKVVLIDFWTYSCINCLRSLPYIKEWAEKYKNDDFVVIGVHTPEFAFEKNVSNVKDAVKELGISYPVAVDSNYKIWNAFGNQYWPAHYFIDRQGRIRHHHFGEGDYEESEKVIRELISENGGSIQAKEVEIQGEGAEAPANPSNLQSPETYVGYARAENFSKPNELVHDKPIEYKFAPSLQKNEWSLSGEWLISLEKAILKKAHGKIQFRFHARDLHLVLGAPKKIKFKVTIDGKPPGENHGIDIDENGFGEIQSNRLYQLIRQNDRELNSDHIFEIEFLDSGAEVYAFTFG